MLVQRPWGSYEILLDEPTYKVKRIILNPLQQFSLQYHNNRFEYWTIVEGSGIITLKGQSKNQVITCIPGDFFHIFPKDVHRATAGIDGLSFIEVQRGQCSEDDIVRIEDDYGRLAQR